MNRDYTNFNVACKKAIRKILMEYNYERLIKDNEVLLHMVPEHFQEDFKTYMENRRKAYKIRYKYAMFTINFKENMDYKEIYKKTLKCLEKKWIKDHLARFECRDFNKESNEWIGIHLHFWCEIIDNKNVYHCKREVYNTFKHLVGNKQHVNVKYSNAPDAFKQYVLGIKNNEYKPNYQLDQELNEFMDNL